MDSNIGCGLSGVNLVKGLQQASRPTLPSRNSGANYWINRNKILSKAVYGDEVLAMLFFSSLTTFTTCSHIKLVMSCLMSRGKMINPDRKSVKKRLIG